MPALRSLGYRTQWLVVSLGLHAVAVAGLMAVYWNGVEPEPEPIPVTLLEESPPAEEPERPPAQLRFGRASHPRVRESVEIPRQVLALEPPPLDAPLEARGAASGLAATPAAPSALSRFAVGGAGSGWAGSGSGLGNGAAPAGSFQEYVGGLRRSGLDVVFVIDATGSMGWLLDEVKTRVRGLADWMRRLVPLTRFGVVAYRDDDDDEFVVRVHPLTFSVERVRRFLDALETRGGGDLPEAVDAGLEAAMRQAGWKPDTRHVIVVVGDAPPHPERLEATLALAREFHAGGGTVTTVDVSFDANPALAAARLGKRVDELQTLDPRGVMPEFRALARAGGGDGATLEGDASVVRQLAVLIFGSQWAEAVRPLLGTL